MTAVAERLANCRILPVITCSDSERTLQLTGVLANSGIDCVEITLRTPNALQCLGEIKAAFPNLTVAAGTITTPETMNRAADAGADMCVSPGLTAELLQTATGLGMPFLPGVATASEIMLGLRYGCEVFKLFPADAIGGVDLLTALAGPFPDVRFCPTGGLTAQNLPTYLALPNVICCGGSWMVAPELVKAAAWSEIELLAREAVALTR